LWISCPPSPLTTSISFRRSVHTPTLWQTVIDQTASVSTDGPFQSSSAKSLLSVLFLSREQTSQALLVCALHSSQTSFKTPGSPPDLLPPSLPQRNSLPHILTLLLLSQTPFSESPRLIPPVSPPPFTPTPALFFPDRFAARDQNFPIISADAPRALYVRRQQQLVRCRWRGVRRPLCFSSHSL